MPIETDCQGCGKRLRVGDEFAGRRARCPNCQTEYTVPRNDGGAAPHAAEQWRLKTADGVVFGPVEKNVLDQWSAEGRIGAGALLQCEGDSTWRPATIVYPPREKQPFAGGANPFGERASPASNNPYASPMNYSGPFAGVGPTLAAHHGALLLVLSIVGWLCLILCGLCGVFGLFAFAFFVPALVIGISDLRAMREGRMDDSGHGLTKASVIVSGIGAGLGVVGFVGILVVIVAAIAGA